MIANPIIRRELRSALRTRKAILMQAAFLAVTGALVFLYWPAGGFQDIQGDTARDMFAILALGQLVMVILIAPAFTAAALTSERERNTIESLFTTTLKPWEIAFGKIVGSTGFLLLVILTGMPVLALPFLMGGVAGWELLAVMGVLLLSAVYVGMIGLLVSSLMHRSYRAIIATYGVLLVVCFLLALPATPLSNNLLRRGGPGWRDAWHVLASFSPIEAMMSVVWPKHPWAAGAPDMPAFWRLFLPMGLLATAAISGICLVKLRRPIGPPKSAKLKVVERGKITARTFLFVVDPRKRKRMIAFWQNPMLMKEFRTRPMLQAQWLLRAVGWCIVASVLLMIVQSITIQAALPQRPQVQVIEEDLPAVIAVLSVVMIVLVGPAVTGGTLSSDRESGVWDLVRTTRLPSWRIVSGKFQASVIPLLLLVLSILPTLMVLPFLVSFKVNLWPTVLRVSAVLLSTTVFVAAAGMFFSGLCSRTSVATAWTYAVMVALGLLTLLMLAGEGRFSQRIIGGVFVVSPLAAALDAAGNTTMRKYQIMVPHLEIIGTLTVLMFVVAVVRAFQLRRPDK